ncbi:ribbon-helix-helix protein, CopG family [Nostoc sp. CHAB 5834]|nr:ribbon-helix-helix protein, CopG family [Nostoc sp. CHAB 5834]
MNSQSILQDLDTGQSFATDGLSSEQVSSNASSVKRMSISLPGDIARLLQYLADTQGISQNEALRKAIATEAYLLDERQQGTKVLLQKANKEIREVLFR